jgi:hypothetical protein
MSDPSHILILNGSPRGAKGLSESFANYLQDRFAERGLETEEVRIGTGLPDEQKLDEISSAVERAELVTLITPLYVDSQPAPVVRAMEHIAERRRGSSAEKSARFAVIINCGLPETFQNDVALRIYRRFADEAGLRWAGGLALGMGEALEQKPLAKAGWLARNVRKSLDLSAAALAGGRDIPDEAVVLMAKRLLPYWLYTFLGQRSWRQQAKEHGAKTPLGARPYEP